LTYRIVLLLLSCWAVQAANYADQLLTSAASEIEALENDPLNTFLLAERVYYLAHESGSQERIAELLETLFEKTTHGEVRAEIGTFLTQHYRQLGETDKVADLVRRLGYVREWRVLGPLETRANRDLKPLVADEPVRGLDREVQPFAVAAYGAEDHFSEGIGQYGYFAGNLAVFPNQLATAYYSTWFYAPRKGDYRLGVGWANQMKVFVNKTLVLEGREKQKPHPDQAVTGLTLRKGWYRLSLLIDSAAEDPNLGFFVRLTDAEGTPLETDAERRNRLPGRSVTVVPAETSLAALARASSPYALATVLLTKEQLRHSQYAPPRDLLTQSLQSAPSRAVVDKLMSLTEDTNTAWRLLTDFLETATGLDRAWTLTQMGQIALEQKRYWQARQYAEQALTADPDFWPASVLRNNVFAGLGLHGEALRHTRDLAAQYPGVPWIMMDLSDLYNTLDFRQEAEAQTDAVIAIRHGLEKFNERKVAFLVRRGDTDALDAFYEQILRAAPYSMNTLESYVDFLANNNRTDKARSLLENALAQLPENPRLLQSMGALEMKAGGEDALFYLERALALQPQNPTLEKMITLSKSEEQAFYEPYRIEEAAEVFVREVSPIVINLDNRVRRVAPNGQSSYYHQLEYEILTEQGVRELPGYAFSYAPLREKAQVIRAEIVREDKIIHLTDFGRRRVSDPAYRMFYDLVSYQIPFIGLQVGDIVKLEYRIDDISGENIYGDYFGDQQYFSNSLPTRQLTYTLIVPEDLEIHYHVDKMNPVFRKDLVGDELVYAWTMAPVSPYETETLMPGVQGYMPYVAVSTFDDWQSMAKWYKTLIEGQLTLDLETKAIVAALTEGVTDTREIVARIHEYVITNTRYVALEFGIHGYKPYEVNQVCTRQFGDCKDKASLIIAMLREAGVDASIAIVRTADMGAVHTYPAMLTYFNHAIVYVPDLNLYLDGTAEFSGMDELPVMDQGALTLVVDETGRGKLTTIPIYDNTREGTDLRIALDDDGSAEVSGNLSYTGSITPQVRQYLSIDARLEQNLQELISDRLPGLDVLEAAREGRAINEPITLSFRGRSNQVLQRSAEGLELPLSILNDTLVRAYAPNAERRFPIDFGTPKQKSVRLTISAPEGWKPFALPEPIALENEDFAIEFSFEKQNDRQISVDYRLRFKTSRVEPESYQSLREMLQAHDRVIDQSIRFVSRATEGG